MWATADSGRAVVLSRPRWELLSHRRAVQLGRHLDSHTVTPLPVPSAQSTNRWHKLERLDSTPDLVHCAVECSQGYFPHHMSSLCWPSIRGFTCKFVSVKHQNLSHRDVIYLAYSGIHKHKRGSFGSQHLLLNLIQIYIFGFLSTVLDGQQTITSLNS